MEIKGKYGEATCYASAIDSIKRRKDRKENGWKIENYPISGVKAQFNHARCISNKLGVEIENEMFTLL